MEHETVATNQPADFHLLTGEEFRSVVEYPPRSVPSRLSSLEQMQRLTRAVHSGDIGHYGPSIAALSFDTAAQTPDHLRLYEVVFGRDSLRVAIDLLSSYPELARSTVLELARYQGTSYNKGREEEPGRIVHEARDDNDPIARELTSRLGWDWPYYGSVDATPEFIRTLAGYCNLDQTNLEFLQYTYIDRNGQERKLSDALDRAVEWITRRLDSNPEGLLEFKSVLATGIENQVWKDSWDAYHHSDGTLANHRQGIASIEVQVTTYDALLDAADLYDQQYGATSHAADLRERAGRLKQTILQTFWTEDTGGYFVLGTDRDDDGQLRQLKIRTSNMGHALNSRLLEDDDPAIIRKKQALMQQLLSPDLLNVSGIRTLAKDEVRFRPGAYHCGSVWLWDTHHIAKGMRRLGYPEEADELDRRMLRVVEATNSFPEYVSGDDEPVPHVNRYTITVWDNVNQRLNKVEQPPQEVQAWTVAAILAIKKRMARRGLFPGQRSAE